MVNFGGEIFLVRSEHTELFCLLYVWYGEITLGHKRGFAGILGLKVVNGIGVVR